MHDPGTWCIGWAHGVFWLGPEMQVNYLQVGGRRSLKKVDQNEPM